jgi:hypothetical protein
MVRHSGARQPRPYNRKFIQIHIDRGLAHFCVGAGLSRPIVFIVHLDCLGTLDCPVTWGRETMDATFRGADNKGRDDRAPTIGNLSEFM